MDLKKSHDQIMSVWLFPLSRKGDLMKEGPPIELSSLTHRQLAEHEPGSIQSGGGDFLPPREIHAHPYRLLTVRAGVSLIS